VLLLAYAAATVADLRRYMEAYYSMQYEQLAQRLGCCTGTGTACAGWLDGFRQAGARHLILRFGADDQSAQLKRAAVEVFPHLRNSYPRGEKELNA
jgi:hypothetical protein